MAEKTIFPREEKADVLFNKILNDPWACEKLQGTFCNSLFCNEDNNFPLSPDEFSQALFNAYHNRDLSAFLMAICQNTLFDLLRNSFLIPYRFNADGRTNPIIMTDESGNLLPGYKTTVHEKITSIFMMSTVILTIRKIFILHRPTVTAMPMLLKKWIWISRFWKKIPVY